MTNPNQKIDELHRPDSDDELDLFSEGEVKVEGLIKWFDETGIPYEKFAYPNVNDYMHIPGQHNTQKWLQAISDIYRKEKAGQPRKTAIRSIVGGWNIMETFDFLNWIKFYESGDHVKYKYAQLWYENDNLGPGYFLQIKKDAPQAKEPEVTGKDIDVAKADAESESDRRHTIEKQRNKIIGRLDSAEKLLRSQDGHIFSGKEFESLLESIYQLKKKIQMVNKISASTRLYEDMIIRESNVLSKRGYDAAANLLFSCAQAAPTPTPPEDPTGAGNPGLPSGGAATSAQPPGDVTMPQSEPNNPPQPKGITDFLERMDNGKFTTDDDSKVEDDLEVEDTLDVFDNGEELIVEAQISPEEIGDSTKPSGLNPAKVEAPKPAAPPAPVKAPASADEKLEVTEDDIKSPSKETLPSTSNFDAKVDAMLDGISIADVVAKLEDLAKIFKTREVPRQLSIVDMMLDHLDLASYFPSLSEATNKALESNNYISTRVEDILSKLRGAMGTNAVDLKGESPKEDSPEVTGIKNKLQTDADKEKARKQQRKDQENAELANNSKETPEVEMDEDLAPETPPGPAKPVAPPA